MADWSDEVERRRNAEAIKFADTCGVRDGRTDAEIIEDARVRRMVRAAAQDRTASAAAIVPGAEPKKFRTFADIKREFEEDRAKALSGTDGETFYTSLRCLVCGGIPFVNRYGRIKSDCDAAKHGAAERIVRGGSPQEVQRVLDGVMDRAQRARRSTGEDDD